MGGSKINCLLSPKQFNNFFVVTKAVHAHMGKHSKFNKNCCTVFLRVGPVNHPFWPSSDAKYMYW